MSRIGIDCRLAGSKHAGIGRYTENLILNLIKKKSKTHWILFFYDEDQAQDVLGNKIKNKQIEIVLAPIKHYSLEEQIKLPKIFNSTKLDLLHIPHFNVPIFYRGKLIVTIHDLLWHEYKGGTATTLTPIKYFFKYFFYKLVTRLAVTKAKKVIVPAETIKNTIIKFYPRTKNKILITKEGGKIGSQKSKSISTQKNKLKKTLLYVGSLYPHKNIGLILRSLTTLKEYELLIVGSRNIFVDRVKKIVKNKEIQDRVTFLGYVDDKELSDLYLKVTALIQPSFSEGFGLTGVEAMSLGTPILASDIPIFKEIYQDIAYYFSPHSETSFINAIHELEKDNTLKNTSKKRVKASIELSKTYSWSKMASKTLEAYKNIIGQ